jgi:formylmethanofuran dehydrogenase subunit E
MSYFRTGDPLDDFNRLDREQAQYLESFPVCERCGKPIQDEHLYLINDEFVCPECLYRDFRKDTEDYVKCF